MTEKKNFIKPAPLDCILYPGGIAQKECTGKGSCGKVKPVNEFYAKAKTLEDCEGRNLCIPCHNKKMEENRRKREKEDGKGT